MDPTRSSTNKGESIEDTFANLGAMDPDGIIIRHEDNDIARKLADMNLASVINAGAGNRAHPTQALLDLFTLKEHFGELKGKKVAIIGDIANSRVASSLLLLLPRFGVELKLVAPKPFMPQEASCEKYENIADIIDMPIEDSYKYFMDEKSFGHFNEQQTMIASSILREIRERLFFLYDVGLGYLALSRDARTISGGEAQRIRIASQIGSGLTGVLYVLDEPSIGLHERDTMKLIRTLKTLQEKGNSVIVVEHDKETIESADFIVDIGPGAGEYGGEVVFAGTLEELKKSDTSTAAYL
ncbi:MAG: hypothetical protein P8Y43_08700, partial [Sulfurovaceae bacterium]